MGENAKKLKVSFDEIKTHQKPLEDMVNHLN